ncbi:MAG: biotin--[acetyl-CoA-carboxylase] ligase [Candidatus Cloacimonetes bacterium]|mgnify:FL=1|nr:biotin--[acetyl-CoA-carboxylase] ligase [Candidatus Cloacimonadota bacterium]HNZ06401.1 biotin--[acetyl-CoA-carboxylase] ligase [Candidatus Cloacimonadota bacterium]HPN40136.1 biotin--[acetyl-CoA-carboxylase] ligase [Candidatus Cloacimonadota bacterium]
MKANYLFDTVESTMLEYEKIRGISSEYANITVRAVSQSGGMGRGGHRWHSPQGGLWFTFDFAHQEAVESFALYAGHCLHKLLRRLYRLDDLKIKWTNDIYYQDKKIAGILCRYQIVEHFYVIGLGLNTNNTVDPDIIPTQAVPLREILSYDVSNEYLMKLFIAEMNDNKHLLDQPSSYLEYCDANLYGKGRVATLEQGRDLIEGRILGLDEYGHLRLDCGELKTISYGTLVNIG